MNLSIHQTFVCNFAEASVLLYQLKPHIVVCESHCVLFMDQCEMVEKSTRLRRRPVCGLNVQVVGCLRLLPQGISNT